MTPEQRLEQAVRFMEWQERAVLPTGDARRAALAWWLRGKEFDREDEDAVYIFVARLMSGEDPDIIVTSLEQTGEAA